MEIRMTQNATFDNTLSDLCRRTEPLEVDKKTLVPILEEEGTDSPLVIFVAGVRSGGRPGYWNLRECRSLLIYEGAAFKEREKIRREEEEKTAAQAARKVKLNRIKMRLKARLKADESNFDKRFDAQSREQAAAAERAIEEEALAVLRKEEN